MAFFRRKSRPIFCENRAFFPLAVSAAVRLFPAFSAGSPSAACRPFPHVGGLPCRPIFLSCPLCPPPTLPPRSFAAAVSAAFSFIIKLSRACAYKYKRSGNPTGKKTRSRPRLAAARKKPPPLCLAGCRAAPTAVRTALPKRTAYPPAAVRAWRPRKEKKAGSRALPCGSLPFCDVIFCSGRFSTLGRFDGSLRRHAFAVGRKKFISFPVYPPCRRSR